MVRSTGARPRRVSRAGRLQLDRWPTLAKRGQARPRPSHVLRRDRRRPARRTRRRRPADRPRRPVARPLPPPSPAAAPRPGAERPGLSVGRAGPGRFGRLLRVVEVGWDDVDKRGGRAGDRPRLPVTRYPQHDGLGGRRPVDSTHLVGQSTCWQASVLHCLTCGRERGRCVGNGPPHLTQRLLGVVDGPAVVRPFAFGAAQSLVGRSGERSDRAVTLDKVVGRLEDLARFDGSQGAVEFGDFLRQFLFARLQPPVRRIERCYLARPVSRGAFAVTTASAATRVSCAVARRVAAA